MAGMMAMPVNMAKILAAQLAAQTADINANTDGKATATQTAVNANVDAKAGATQTAVDTVGQAVGTETQAIDDKLASMTAVNGELDTNATVINNHITAELIPIAAALANPLGTKINDVSLINAYAPRYVAADGSEWLRSGYAETNVALYPDARVSYAGQSASLGAMNGEGSYFSDFAVGGGYIWAVAGMGAHNAGKVCRYHLSGVYSGFSFNIGARVQTAGGICYKNSTLLLVDSTNKTVEKFTTSGGNAGSVALTGFTSGTEYLCWTGSHYWIHSGTEYFQLDSAFNQTGKKFSELTNYDGQGICFDGGFLYFFNEDNTSRRVYQLTLDGEFTGDSFKVNGGNAGLDWDATNKRFLTLFGGLNSYLYRFDQMVGMGEEIINAETGLHYYARVK